MRGLAIGAAAATEILSTSCRRDAHRHAAMLFTMAVRGL
jgi:hypothetical protein